MAFETNVFINCPFDDEYKKLLKPLLFTLLYLRLEPRIAQTLSSAHVRATEIKEHIRNCKFGIHDLSRSKALAKDELPRFNMPYELGLDVGCAVFGGKKYRSKKILVLETDRYHYQKVLSDIAGQDIQDHRDDPETLIRKVRDWFSTIDTADSYPSASSIWIVYNQFYSDITKALAEQGFTEDETGTMPVGDFIKLARKWIKTFNRA